MGHIINTFHFARLSKLLLTSGGDTIYGGETNAKALHIQPTLIMNPNDDSLIMNEEIFGPILPIKVYSNIDEVIKYINSKPKPLSVYYYGNTSQPDMQKVQD